MNVLCQYEEESTPHLFHFLECPTMKQARTLESENAGITEIPTPRDWEKA